jgi:hypothetical protein
LALLMLLSLPFPPYGETVLPFVIWLMAVLSATWIWWTLRQPTRVAWRAALILAGLWLLIAARSLWFALRFALPVARGASFGIHLAPAAFRSLLLFFGTVLLQLAVILAWSRAGQSVDPTRSVPPPG